MALEAELKQIDRKIDNLLDRVVEADSQSLVVRYENRIKELEDSRIVMEEKAAQCGRTLADFEKGFRTAPTTIPFKVLEGIRDGRSKMVGPLGLEPRTKGL